MREREVVSRYIDEFTEDKIIKVIKAYLIDGFSHRKIQWEILGIPAPDRGGGFIAMDILHYFDIDGTKKEILRNNEINDLIVSSNGKYQKALKKLKAYLDEEIIADKVIKGLDIDYVDNTEIKVTTKQRVGQDVLRRYILDIYGQECALCQIDKADLLICSHIVPWKDDEKNRLNPRNAICLCALHDKLFDRGYFSLNQNHEIIYTAKSDDMINVLMKDLEFKAPNENTPDPELLKRHYQLYTGE